MANINPTIYISTSAFDGVPPNQVTSQSYLYVFIRQVGNTYEYKIPGTLLARRKTKCKVCVTGTIQSFD